MTYYILFKNPKGRKCKLEVTALSRENAMNNFLKLFPQFTVYHIIDIPEWK